MVYVEEKSHILKVMHLVTGDAAKTPLIEGFLNGPKPPEKSSFNPLTTSIIGPGSGYPKPWRSGSQFAQNGSYGSTIGPYAKLVKLPEGNYLSFGDTSVGSAQQCGGPDGGIYGRLGIGDGVHLGFRAQDWYNQFEGSYDTAYWNFKMVALVLDNSGGIVQQKQQFQ